ncbi:MAG: hypothetical protein ACR2OH_07135, partial [Microthrixaceae bacterium]
LDPAVPAPAGPPGGSRLGSVCEALAGIEADDVNNAIAGALVGAQRFSGCVEPADRSDGTAALLWSAGAVLATERGSVLADDFVGPVAKAVRWLSKQHRKGHHNDIGGVGAWRCAAALRSVAPALAAVGQPEVARDALSLSEALQSAGAASSRRGNPEATDSEGSTFARARAERDMARDGSSAGIEGLAERIPPRRESGITDATGGSGVLGCDAAELAETRLALLDVFVRDAANGPEILAVWPEVWAGNTVEAHGIRTAWGTVSFGLRWHGERAAVLWEVLPSIGGGEAAGPVVRVPGLDPEFAGTGWSGEGLLDIVGAQQATRPTGGRATDGRVEPGTAHEGESFS